MKPSNSFINKKKANKTLNENIPKNNKIKTLTRQIQPNLLQLNTIKNKSFSINQKFSSNLTKKISYKNTSNNKSSKPDNKKLLDINHRPSISTDFSLSLEFGSLMNINKNMDDNNNEDNVKCNKKKFIKVNTKRNNYTKNLSLKNQSKTNRKYDKNSKKKNIEKFELFKNISEINIFNNKKTKTNYREDTLYEYDINKIVYLQKWWKTILRKKYNSTIILIKSIKKLFLIKPFILIKNIFPKIYYFLYKWRNIVNKQKIIKSIIKNRAKIKKSKKMTKSKNNRIKISPRNSINNTNQNASKNSKKSITNVKLQHSSKKIISINTNVNNMINTNNSNCCQTTKHNINNKINYINFHINNTKKAIPCSPKANSIIERHTSPINNLAKQTQTKKTSVSKKFKKSKNKEKSNKIENKKIGKMKIKKISPKSKTIRENIIDKKNNSKLNNIISHNNSNSKSDKQSFYEESNSGVYSNPNSQFNNYISNINKNPMDLAPHYHNYSKGEKNENKLNDDNINVEINTKNNKSQYYKTDTGSNKTNSFFKNQISKSNSKVYENRLQKDNRYKNFGTQENKELININCNTNNIAEKKINKKNTNNSIPINKHVILHKKDKAKLSKNKEFSNHKKNFGHNISKSSSNQNISEENASKVSSLDNNSNKHFKNKNLIKQIFFHLWKEYIDKNKILRQFINLSKFLYQINHYKKIISLKNSMQKLIEIQSKEKLFKYFLNLIFKMIINIFKKIYIYKTNNNMREIKIFKKNDLNHILTNYEKSKADIINNININNYINYEDYNLKRKAQSPNLKEMESKVNNKNSNFDYYNKNKRYTIINSNSENYIDFSRATNRNNYTYRNKDDELISIKIYNDDVESENKNIIHINNEILKNNNSGYLNNKILDKNNQKIEGGGVIIDQINQLKMVFNLIERHTFKNKISLTLFDCFNKWKLYSLNKIKALKKKTTTPRISEKIINLKPFQSSNIINNNIQKNSSNFPLKKNFSLSRMSPKIINVINVQNFNENNNYNYNFKYMPIKDIPIYSIKPRYSYAYNSIDTINNLNNLNNEINNIGKNNIKFNNINENVNNNLNTTSFMMVNGNKQINSNIIYHKKKLGSTFINNNYNFNFNNNLENLVNNSNYDSNCYYKLEQKGNFDNSSFLFLDQNQSQILLPSISNRIYNLEKHNMKLGPVSGIFRDNSFKGLRSCLSKEHHPEKKFGFKKLNQIEEKEINFENRNEHNNNNKKPYIKKQHLENKTKIKINTQNNIKKSVFNDKENKNEGENIDKKNLIKSLNIQFGRSKVYKKRDEKSNNFNCVTISEDIYENKNNINVKKGQISLKKKNFKHIFSKNVISESEENNISTKKRIFSCKFIRNQFKFNEKIKKERINISFDACSDSNINDIEKIKVKYKYNYSTL